jgi:hypothetical protein
LLLAPAEFEAAFLEVLADGLWAHLRSAFQRLKMERHPEAFCACFELVDGRSMDAQ